MGLLDRISLQRVAVEPPDRIELSDRGELLIVWPEGPPSSISFFKLRDLCPCAVCIEEGTGRKLLDPATIPADIRPLEIRNVGNYAVQILWSDGHSTGFYGWQMLRDAGRA